MRKAATIFLAIALSVIAALYAFSHARWAHKTATRQGDLSAAPGPQPPAPGPRPPAPGPGPRPAALETARFLDPNECRPPISRRGRRGRRALALTHRNSADRLVCHEDERGSPIRTSSPVRIAQ